MARVLINFCVCCWAAAVWGHRNKREARSYSEICLTVGVDSPSHITFATDVLAEAVAAKQAGSSLRILVLIILFVGGVVPCVLLYFFLHTYFYLWDNDTSWISGVSYESKRTRNSHSQLLCDLRAYPNDTAVLFFSTECRQQCARCMSIFVCTNYSVVFCDAGLQAVLVLRPGNAPLPPDHGFRTISSLLEL